VTSPSHRILIHDRALTRGQARRLSRRFDHVGVTIPAARLRQLSAGARAGEDELTDLSFAVAASEIERENRQAKLRRSKRQLVRWLIVAGLVLLLLNSMVCVAYMFFTVTMHTY
jgi:hypothetical protein